MPGELILDTGAFIALVDRSKRQHAECVSVLEHWQGPVLTTEPVLTEALHLVGPGWRHQQICLAFFLRGALVIVPSSPRSLERAAVLMDQYQNVPMDYADATLVVLAEELETNQIFTLDRRGFSTYRARGRTSFVLHP